MSAKMAVWLAGLTLLSAGALTGCVSKKAFHALETRVAASETRLTEADAARTTLRQQLATSDGKVVTLSEQVSGHEKNLVNIGEEIKSVSSSARNTRLVLVKNLMGERDTHKQQYLALEQIINDLNTQAPNW